MSKDRYSSPISRIHPIANIAKQNFCPFCRDIGKFARYFSRPSRICTLLLPFSFSPFLFLAAKDGRMYVRTYADACMRVRVYTHLRTFAGLYRTYLGRPAARKANRKAREEVMHRAGSCKAHSPIPLQNWPVKKGK